MATDTDTDTATEPALHSPSLSYVCEELERIGIKVVLVPQVCGFLKGIRIVDGALHVSPECTVSNVLHEAGHLAIIPGIYRGKANDRNLRGKPRLSRRGSSEQTARSVP